VAGCLHGGPGGICNVSLNYGDIPVLRGGFIEVFGIARVANSRHGILFGCRITLGHSEFTTYAAEFTCDASGRWVYGSFKFPYLA
jgi:hypothetical protein